MNKDVIIACDFPDADTTLKFLEQFGDLRPFVKIGMELYYGAGPDIVRRLRERGHRIFLDLKLHDIPHQIRGAAESASRAGADILSIHGLGGDAMVAAAREGVEAAAVDRDERTRLVSITVLTSMDQESLAKIGIDAPVADEVSRLATLACGAGSDGIVCSPQEAAAMRELLGSDALIVTPGVRPAGSEVGDQRRIATPAAAVSAGATQLVVGRPITQADDPVAAFDAIVEELDAM